MLSYRHSFHAGNFADVLKHIIQVEVLEYLCQKDKAFDYIDTHAGAGIYSLTSDHAKKTGEFEQGIGRMVNTRIPEISGYLDAVKACNDKNRLQNYPGSPYIANQFLRSQDQANLFELHPADFQTLNQLFQSKRQIKVHKKDGYEGLLSLLPPKSRRGLVLIDPPYEVKEDYQKTVSTIIQAHKKFATGTFAIWYPVVDRARIVQMLQSLKKSGIRRIQVYELGLTADTKEHGMTASGMIVINPPWTLMDRMKIVLPKLLATIDANNTGFYQHDELVGE